MVEGQGGLCHPHLRPSAVMVVEEQEELLRDCLELLHCLTTSAVVAVVVVGVLDCCAWQLPLGCQKAQHPMALPRLSAKQTRANCKMIMPAAHIQAVSCSEPPSVGCQCQLAVGQELSQRYRRQCHSLVGI